MKTHVIGMDGCRGGWVVCRLNVETLAVDLIAVARSLADVLEREETTTHIAVDIPIGLPETGLPRQCDLQARRHCLPFESTVKQGIRTMAAEQIRHAMAF